jgi:Fungal specific transcription factor domain
MLAYQHYGEPPDYEGMSESLFQLYRLRTAQSLIMGDIAKCLPYTIEALRLNATAEFNRKDDTSRGLWIMTGVMVRAAINMGYHRDPSQSPSISPFQAEYRRRVWLSVMEMDDMASFTAGFPRLISDIHTDTMEPRNVHDWELSNDLAVLPPPRPISEPTFVTYLIVKTRFLRALSRISDFNNTTSSSSYNEILEIDNSLYETYQNFPPYMKMDSVKLECTAEGKKADISTLQLALMYHIGMCQLHRRFIAKGRLDPQYNHSRDRCIASALAILSYQSFIDPVWYRLSRTRKTYALPAMLLFLELEYRRRSPVANAFPDNNSIFKALDTSCALWEDAKYSCDESEKLHQTLAGVLSSFQTSASSNYSSQPQTPGGLFAFPGIASPLQTYTPNLLDDKDMFAMSNEMDIDWVGFPCLIVT